MGRQNVAWPDKPVESVEIKLLAPSLNYQQRVYSNRSALNSAEILTKNNTLSERISLNRLFGVDETSSYVQFFLVQPVSISSARGRLFMHSEEICIIGSDWPNKLSYANFNRLTTSKFKNRSEKGSVRSGNDRRTFRFQDPDAYRCATIATVTPVTSSLNRHTRRFNPRA